MKTRFKFLVFASCILIAAPAMKADDVSDLKAQLQALQQQFQALQQQLQKMTVAIERQQTVPPAADAPAAANTVSPHPDKPVIADRATHGIFERKPVDGFTFYTPGGESGGGEITAYSNLDMSTEVVTKGISKLVGPDGSGPIGKVGWQPDISTNISYIGVRGFQSLGTLPFNFVYQFETGISISSISGAPETNSSESNNVNGFTSRDSYIGLASERWGAIKVGKTFAPYKKSTARLNPFSGEIGDYQVIMGNTGGDNRVEFGALLDHSIWYESPHWHGFDLNVLYSPGQNRSNVSDNLAAGEADCTGGNIPGSGGIVPVSCSDGAFSDAVSTSLSYTKGGFYAVAAYERHEKVNRSSDITGLYGSGNAYSQTLEAQDVADEDAGKAGLQYLFRSRTSIGGIYESMHRYVPADLMFQNERQRHGSWFVISQGLTRNTSLHMGWAHAFRTPGDPGQHNDSLITPPGGVPGVDATAGTGANNQANLLTSALKYKLSENLSIYTAWAVTANGSAAHYDLGAGGRTITTDCHDASDATGGLVASNPHCWTGGRLQGLSLGLVWKF
jgi:predicted porin